MFIFLLLGRICDIYLNSLHLPLVVSLVTLFFAITSGQLSFALTSTTAKFMFGFTIWMIIGIPFSLWPSGSFEVFSDWMKSFTSFIVIMAMVDTVGKAARMLQVIAASVLCATGLTLVAADHAAGRLMLYKGFYSGPNELSTACVTGLIAWSFVLGQRMNPVVRLILLPCVLFVAYVLPRTGSRSGLITMLVVLLLFLTRFSMAKRVGALLGAAIGLFVLFIVAPPEIRLRYTSLFSETEATTRAERQQKEFAQGSSEERLRLLKDSLDITAQYPVFGTGAGNFGLARFGKMISAGQRGSYQGTHNTYTQISSELGIPGFIFFALSLVYCWRNVRRIIRLYKPLKDPHSKMVLQTAYTLWLLLAAYMVTFCFEYIGYQPFYLIVCALITSFSHAALRDYTMAQMRQNQQGMQPA